MRILSWKPSQICRYLAAHAYLYICTDRNTGVYICICIYVHIHTYAYAHMPHAYAHPYIWTCMQEQRQMGVHNQLRIHRCIRHWCLNSFAGLSFAGLLPCTSLAGVFSNVPRCPAMALQALKEQNLHSAGEVLGITVVCCMVFSCLDRECEFSRFKGSGKIMLVCRFFG